MESYSLLKNNIVKNIIALKMSIPMQGMIVLRQIQTEISQGVMPAAELIGGAIVFAGGILLLTPGIATDVVGFAVMVPFLRHRLQSWILIKFQDAVERGTFKVIS